MAFSFEEYPTRAAAMAAAAGQLQTALQSGLAERGAAAAALSGGGTPELAYADLAARHLDWRRISFALVDERFVAPNHPASNEAMLRRALAPALSEGAEFLPMWAPDLGLAAAAERADQAYAALHLDAALLGMGADAHTASWFPQDPALGAALDPAGARSVIAVEAEGAAGAAARLTLTYPALARTKRIILLITGEEKRTRLDLARTQTAAQAPISAVLHGLADRLSIIWAH